MKYSSKTPKPLVEIKGFGRELGLFFHGDPSFDRVERELKQLLKKLKFKSFFEDSVIILRPGEVTLSPEELDQLGAILKQESRLTLKLSEPVVSAIDTVKVADVPQNSFEAEPTLAKSEVNIPLFKQLQDKGWRADEALVVYQTLRSGQNIYSEKTIVLLGDLNPGAELVSHQNIIVLGTIRGMVHAGAEGDLRSTIICLGMRPTQIRIAHLITQPPPGENRNTGLSLEQAFVESGQIVIDSYQKKSL